MANAFVANADVTLNGQVKHANVPLLKVPVLPQIWSLLIIVQQF